MLCEQHCIVLHTALHATGCNVAHVTPYQPSTELSLISLDPFCYCSVLCVYVKYITKGSVFSQEAIPGSTVPMAGVHQVLRSCEFIVSLVQGQNHKSNGLPSTLSLLQMHFWSNISVGISLMLPVYLMLP